MRRIVLLIFLCFVFAGKAMAATAKDTNARQDKQMPEEPPFVCTLLEDMPQFPGGDIALMRYIHSHLRLPDSLEEVPGRVMIRFVVNEDGSLSHITVERKCAPQLKALLLDLVKGMPRWKPGSLMGKPAKTTYLLPVEIKLQ